MERVGRRTAVRGGIGQWLNDLHLFDDRAGPAVRDDHGQCAFMPRAHVDEMNVESVDFGDELRQRVQPGLDLAPIVLSRPIAREGLSRRELHALRGIGDRLPLGPLRRGDPAAELVELLLGDVDAEGADGGLGHVGLRTTGGLRHGGLLASCGAAERHVLGVR